MKEGDVVKQKDLVRLVGEHQRAQLMAIADDGLKALLNGMSEPHAGAFKDAYDITDHCYGENFQLMMKRSLRIPIIRAPALCPLCKLAEFDIHGDHALSCASEGFVVHRHDDIKLAVRQLALEAGQNWRVEEKIPLKGRESRAIDLFCPDAIPGSSHRTTCLDVTVTNDFGGTAIKGAAKNPGDAALRGEERKNSEYAQLLANSGYDFIPLSFSATGGCTPKTQQVIKWLIHQKAIVSNTPVSEVAAPFWQKISTIIHRSAAVSIKRRRDAILTGAT